MISREKQQYFNATVHRETRGDLKLAVGLVDGPKVAIDCGCGAGSDIAFLRTNGFLVYAFDLEGEVIDRCRERFHGDSKVILSTDSFSSFEYPGASLILADASLFFCPEKAFANVWGKITASLLPGGIFVGSFLGPDDTMAGANYDRDAFWPNVFVTSKDQVMAYFTGFDVITFTEHRTSGKTVNGSDHNWHIFSVVARKETNN